MRLLMMHKNDPRTEAGEPPDAALVKKMGELVGGLASRGKLVDGAGLSGSKDRTRLVFRGGAATVTHGPYVGARELPAALLLLEVRTRDEALRWAERYGAILGDGEIEVGRVNEPWDIGVAPKPDDPPLHVLLVEKASPATEAPGRSAAQREALAELRAEMTAAGVLQRAHVLAPSTQAKRLVFRKNVLTATDGPFAESKELLGGFVVVDLADVDEAVAFCVPYAAILGGDLEMDVRVVDARDGAV